MPGFSDGLGLASYSPLLIPQTGLPELLIEPNDAIRAAARCARPSPSSHHTTRVERRGTQRAEGCPDDGSGFQPSYNLSWSLEGQDGTDTLRNIEVLRFVEPEELPGPWYDRPYYLGPDGDPAIGGWAALASALEKTGLVTVIVNRGAFVRTLTLDKPVTPEVVIVVPGRSYAELMRVLPDAETPIEITVTPNKSQVLFHVEGIDLVSRLIEGQFPNYEPVIPTSHSSRAVIDREAFLAGTRRASIFARDSANIVKIELGAEDGDGTGVSITAHAADVGDNADSVDATIEGSPTSIAFNARYLIDVLSNLGSDEAALELSGPLAPGVIRGIGKDDYVHVIMPVRTAS